MLSDHYEIPEILLENQTTSRCSDEAFRFWMGLIETSLLHFPERGVFRYPWRVLDSHQMLNVHNAVSRFPVYDGKRRMRMFNELRELHMIERRGRDGAYFIRAALHAKPVIKPAMPSENPSGQTV
jgi:hypothetical protein